MISLSNDTSLSKDDLRVLEQARQRLYQLTDSLNSLNRDVHNAHPLPSWSSLNQRLSLLSSNLLSLSSYLSTHAPLLSSLAVFPLPEYPGKEQENMLALLLRKKLEPGVEDMVERGYEDGKKYGGGGERGGDGDGEWMEMWRWAMVRANEEARGYKWGEEEEEEEDGGMDADEGAAGGGNEEEEAEEVREEGKPLEMGQVLRFMSTGREPEP